MTNNTEKPGADDTVPEVLRTRKEAKTEAQWEKALSEARSKAVAVLRNENQERFTEVLVEEMAKRGFLYEPRPSAKERAKARLLALAKEAGLTVTIEG